MKCTTSFTPSFHQRPAQMAKASTETDEVPPATVSAVLGRRQDPQELRTSTQGCPSRGLQALGSPALTSQGKWEMTLQQPVVAGTGDRCAWGSGAGCRASARFHFILEGEGKLTFGGGQNLGVKASRSWVGVGEGRWPIL